MKAGTILKPINKRIVVQLDQREGMSAGGIHIPDGAREQSVWGIVRAVAPDCEEITEPGTRVLITTTQGTNIGNDTILIGEAQIKAMEVA
jgi:co-chaperonin GroES (HSP10)